MNLNLLVWLRSIIGMDCGKTLRNGLRDEFTTIYIPKWGVEISGYVGLEGGGLSDIGTCRITVNSGKLYGKAKLRRVDLL